MSAKFILKNVDTGQIIGHFMSIDGIEVKDEKLAENRVVRLFDGCLQPDLNLSDISQACEVEILVLDKEGACLGHRLGFATEIKVAHVNELSEITLHGEHIPSAPAGILSLWTERFNGPFLVLGKWIPLSTMERKAWLLLALRLRKYACQNNGLVEIDGTLIGDEVSFLCAFGEAVFGPCGYMGQCLDGLNDCVRGGGELGVTKPLKLLWKNSSISRNAFIRSGQSDDYESIVEILEDAGIEVLLDK